MVVVEVVVATGATVLVVLVVVAVFVSFSDLAARKLNNTHNFMYTNQGNVFGRHRRRTNFQPL